MPNSCLSRDDLLVAASTLAEQVAILERVLNTTTYITDDLLKAIFNIKEKEDVNV